jgi:hypothetical protein
VHTVPAQVLSQRLAGGDAGLASAGEAADQAPQPWRVDVAELVISVLVVEQRAAITEAAPQRRGDGNAELADDESS